MVVYERQGGCPHNKSGPLIILSEVLMNPFTGACFVINSVQLVLPGCRWIWTQDFGPLIALSY